MTNIPTEPGDFYDRAANQILATRANPKLKRPLRKPPVRLERRKPKRSSVKKALRSALWSESLVYGESVSDLRDNVNRLTNVIWKTVMRPALAAAYADGAEAGADNLAECCGCSGSGPIINPYDGTEFRP